MFEKFIRAFDEFTTEEKSIPAPYIRRGFEIDFVPESANIYITTPGFYELFVNGKKITKGALAPYISNPNHMVCYDEYDVASLLKKGKNAVGIILGNGFANQTVSHWNFNKLSFRAPLCMALTLLASGEGKSLSLDSDESFKVHPSPITYDMYREGTHYDARLEVDGWCEGDFDDSSWDCAMIAPAPKGEIYPCYAHPISVRAEIKPVSIEKQEDFCYYKTSYFDGKDVEKTRVERGYIYDFGINTAGVCRLKIKGKRGQKITVRHCERLLPDGKFNINTTCHAKGDDPDYVDEIRLLQMDEYTLKGGFEEIFTPPFTYHGFRYALVEGITEEQATKELLTYVVLSSDVKKRANFSCSDNTLNTLYKMTVNADLSNFHYFMTDCPHREKNGWTGDASVSADHVHLTFDCADSFKLWLRSLCYAQKEDGMIPGIVPTDTWGYEWGSGPMWDSAAINIPYAAYKYDGRLDVFQEVSDMMNKYLHYIAGRRNERGLIACGLGDWCQPGKAKEIPIKAPLELTDSVTTYDTAKKAAFLFDKIGKCKEAEYARLLAAELKQNIRENLIDFDTMTAAGDCQTSQTYLIATGIFEADENEKAYKKLIEIINRDGRKLDTGMIGLRYIFETLILGGDIDIALELITREEQPSYASMIKRGATALCEALEDGTVNSSENHHFFGDIIRVFTNYIAGLRVNPMLENEKEILFSPVIPTGMDFAETEYNGVKAGWRRDGESIKAYVFLPEGFTGKLSFGSNMLTLANGYNEFTFVA
ncbi:MAG: hypothetical protein E7612_08885 [Ruminococcaceae bacterium]|nr:hypothetical protein [Oscillospiraceae bacterium]